MSRFGKKVHELRNAENPRFLAALFFMGGDKDLIDRTIISGDEKPEIIASIHVIRGLTESEKWRVLFSKFRIARLYCSEPCCSRWPRHSGKKSGKFDHSAVSPFCHIHFERASTENYFLRLQLAIAEEKIARKRFLSFRPQKQSEAEDMLYELSRLTQAVSDANAAYWAKRVGNKESIITKENGDE